MRERISDQDLDDLIGPGNFRELSDLTGYTRQHLSRGLRGIRGLSVDAARAVAAARGLTVDQVLKYVESRRNSD